MSLISISLGVMNLMPLPVLDGGQDILYSRGFVADRFQYGGEKEYNK